MAHSHMRRSAVFEGRLSGRTGHEWRTEVDTIMLLTLLFVSVLLCTLAVVWILWCNSNRWLMKSGQNKRGLAFAVVFGLALAVTGCSGRGKTGSVVYNSSANYDCMGYEIIRDAGTFDYSLKNTSTQVIIRFVPAL